MLLVRELLDGADTAALKSDPVVIAVIDTGRADGTRSLRHGTAENVFLTKSGNIVARNTLNNTSDVRDGASKDYHGTHGTGIVALLIRAFGLADYIKIIPIKAGEYHAGKGNNFYDDDVTRRGGFRARERRGRHQPFHRQRQQDMAEVRDRVGCGRGGVRRRRRQLSR